MKQKNDRLKISLSGSSLKLLAIVTMLIDHVGASILEPLIAANNAYTVVSPFVTGLQLDYVLLERIDFIFRSIGRIAFPIFCFLLVEGFLHTRNKRTYAIRLGIFALLSELPFDLAFWHNACYPEHQNVFFTLFLAFLCMILCEKFLKKETTNAAITNILCGITVLLTMLLAFLLRTDYHAFGILAVMLLYFLRQNPTKQLIGGSLYFFSWEPFGAVAFLPIACYNGKRGFSLKYFFYTFYPLHLLALYGINCLIR